MTPIPKAGCHLRRFQALVVTRAASADQAVRAPGTPSLILVTDGSGKVTFIDGRHSAARTRGTCMAWHLVEYVFYIGWMAPTEQDRIIVAQLAGTARRYARGRELTDAEHDRAVAELIEVASGRPDLLAECAGLAAGFHQGDPDEAAHLQAAQLCIDAGADRQLIPRWAEIGRYRASARADASR